MGMSTASSIDACKGKTLFSSSTEAVASEPIVMQPTISCQNGRGVWLYNQLLCHCISDFFKGSNRGMQLTACTCSHISGNRGYDSNRVRSLSIFHSYCVEYQRLSNHAVLWRGTTRNQDSRGIRLSGLSRIHQAKGEPWGSSVAWVSSHKWNLVSILLWTDQAKEELEQCWSSEPGRLLLKQKGLWPTRQGHPGCKTLQMWTARTSRPPYKCLKWTPCWTMPRKRWCLWWNGLWLRWGTATPRRSMLMW